LISSAAGCEFVGGVVRPEVGVNRTCKAGLVLPIRYLNGYRALGLEGSVSISCLL